MCLYGVLLCMRGTLHLSNIAALPLFQRTDEEAVVDRGGTRSMLNTNFEKEELEGNSHK